MNALRRVVATTMMLLACVQVDASILTPGLRAALTAERLRPVAPRVPLAHFIAQADITDVRLSPDGRSAAWLRDDGRLRGLWIVDVASGRVTRLLRRTDATAVTWLSDSSGIVLESSTRAMVVGTRPGAGRNVLTMLGRRSGRELLGPSDAAGVLVRVAEARGRARRWALLHVDARGRERLVYRGAARPLAYAGDPDGRRAYLQRVEGDALVSYAIRDRRWRRVLACTALQPCALLGMRRDGSALVRLAGDAGVAGLASVDAQGKRRWLASPRGVTYDLDAAVLDTDGTPQMATYRSGGAMLRALTPAAGDVLALLQRTLPGCDCSVQLATGARTGLVAARGQATRWFTLDTRTQRLAPLLHATLRHGGRVTPALPDAQLARRVPVQWTASDGMHLHGMLTVPPGRDPARLPLVVNVHGGPWNAVDPGWSSAVQLLANRGYVVFEPDFRGSTGFGLPYMLAANGDFGNGRVQRDVVEGVEQLLQARIGDPARVGIAGASYGGYATLLGVTYRPDLFKVGVAFVPPPDFAWNARWLQRSRDREALSPIVPLERWLRWLGVDPGDTHWMRRVRGESPLANTARVGAPLLLVAGGRDRRVSPAAVIEYAARLKLAGKPVELLVDPAAGHSNTDPVAQEATLYLMLARLADALGPMPGETLSRKAARYVDANRRL